MYFKKPVIVRLQKDYFRRGPAIGIRDAVMEIDKARAHIRYFTKVYRKFGYDTWLWKTKSLFGCIVCDENDNNALVFHHIGEEFTGFEKSGSISSMVSKQLPLEKIEDEMYKCAVLCANCHQKYEKGGKEALEDLYDMTERYYGIYCPPGDYNSVTIGLEEQFKKNLEKIPIEIVGFFDTAYLNKYARIQENGQEEFGRRR